ncbi:MAG: hypothetical protein NXI24_22795 [bacterium]|nr:hypothetical protein [bacterium]
MQIARRSREDFRRVGSDIELSEGMDLSSRQRRPADLRQQRISKMRRRHKFGCESPQRNPLGLLIRRCLVSLIRLFGIFLVARFVVTGAARIMVMIVVVMTLVMTMRVLTGLVVVNAPMIVMNVAGVAMNDQTLGRMVDVLAGKDRAEGGPGQVH